MFFLDTQVRMQAFDLLRDQTEGSDFAKSMVFESLLLGELVLCETHLFDSILDHNGELGGLMCTKIGRDTARRVLQSGSLQILCDNANKKDDWMNHGANTFFLYSLTQEFFHASDRQALRTMVRYGFLDYLVTRLEIFTHQEVVCQDCCNPRDLEHLHTIRSILLLIPFVDDDCWGTHAVDIFCHALKVAATKVSLNNGQKTRWFTLLQAVLEHGLPRNDDLFRKHGHTYSTALGGLQALCVNGMEDSCCLNCKYSSPYHDLLLLTIFCQSDNVDKGRCANLA